MKPRCHTLVLITIVMPLASIGGWIYSGVYPIGADVPHNRLSYWLLEQLREQSVTRAAADIDIPSFLDGPDRLLTGGTDYNEMCSQCHLQPGQVESDLSLGLYPAPPNLTVVNADSGRGTKALKRRFWIIKHGIKASGMPAWKYRHDDQRIWDMVAFLEHLPSLSPEQYQILTARTNTLSNQHTH